MADHPIYALNLFDVVDSGEYLAYSRRSAQEVTSHGGRVIALGSFSEAVLGDVVPRRVMILVEWSSQSAFDSYRDDPALLGLHRHREAGAGNYVWWLFDKLEDLRPILSQVR